MSRWSALALLLAVAGALALRVPELGIRPLHNDEAVNAVKVSELWQHGRYAYDPDEYHGPTLHYATLPFLWLSGADNPHELKDATLRLAPVAFGIGLILLLWLLADGLGRPAILWAALFISVSPAMVFYSRYFIHEMLLVFFTALTLGAGWRYTQSRSAGWAALAGAGVGLMFATKETFVIPIAAMVAAGVATAWWARPSPRRLKEVLSSTLSACAARGPHVAIALGAAIVVWFVLFSSFFTHFAGLPDSVRTYLPWLQRAGGHSPHLNPWNFYLERLAWFHPARGPVWSEGLILALAAVGALTSLARRSPSRLHVFLVLYAAAHTAAYWIIPYKTPWCLLGFFHGLILLAGIGAAALVEYGRSRSNGWGVGLASAILALTAQLGWQAWRASFEYPADRRNPYVYAQTVPDLLNLVQRAEGIAQVAPAGHKTVIKIIAPEDDYWPLPWYLRRFQHTGWFSQLPDDPYAPIVIVSAHLNARLDEKSERKWIMAGLTELRPGVYFELYVELELWKKFVETLPRETEPDEAEDEPSNN